MFEGEFEGKNGGLPKKKSYNPPMTFDSNTPMDEINWRLLELLQTDARMPFSELGRKVGLSAPAVAERVHRLEEAGVITGYRAQVDPSRLGYSLEAFIRLTCRGNSLERMTRAVSELPQVQEFWNLTGEDGYVLRVILRSVKELDALLKQLQIFGSTTTSLVLSKPVEFRVISAGPETSPPL
ncbi:AsnC family transcriptional regulator [Meiothermus granaticius NBRC 107808]|nr:AsnC family transcriptional regulator [Meiothermus granaticius NBRC 107808]